MPDDVLSLTTEITDLVTEYSGAEIARVHKTLARQGVKSLRTFGAGVVAYPDATSLEVSIGIGLSVEVAPGAAIADNPAHYPAYLEVADGDDRIVAGLTDNSDQNFIFAVIERKEIEGDNDTHETALPLLRVHDQPTLSGGAVLLAQATSANGLVTAVDNTVRTWIRFDQAITDLAALAVRVEELETALAALLGGDGDGETPAIVWQTLQRALDDDRTIEQVIDEKIDLARAEWESLVATGGRRPMQTKDDVIAHELAIIRQEVIKLKKTAGLRSQSANILKTDNDGMYGTGIDSPDHLGPTTLTENEDGSFSS